MGNAATVQIHPVKMIAFKRKVLLGMDKPSASGEHRDTGQTCGKT